jgi:hypothetical protein
VDEGREVAKRGGRIPAGDVERAIVLVRGTKVLLDADLAELYGVSTKALNQAVRRNRARFPDDFCFQLSAWELGVLRSQIVTSKRGSGGRRYLPWAFTEHGALMAATVLSSRRAIEMSVFIVRAFVRLRGIARTHAELASKLDLLERQVGDHDATIKDLLRAVRALLEPPTRPSRRIGFDAGH